MGAGIDNLAEKINKLGQEYLVEMGRGNVQNS